MKNTKSKFAKMLCVLAARIQRICVIALVAVIGFSFAACGGDGGGGGGGSVNGTWKGGDGITLTLDNGSFQITEGNKQTFKGTYTTSGNNIAMVVTHIFGAALKEGLSEGGMDVTIDESKWYNKDQVIDIITNYMKTAGVPDDQISASLADISGDLDTMFPTITGTIDGNTLTFGDETYTKEGGSTGPGTDPDTNPASYSWVRLKDGPFDNTVNAITYANSKFVAVGSYGKMAYSPDGITWTVVGDSKFGNYHIYAIAYGGGKFVAGGLAGRISYSSDGITWTLADTGTLFDYIQWNKTYTSSIRGIAYGGGKFVAGGEHGKIAISSDGITWTPVTTDAFDEDDSVDMNGETLHNKDDIYSIAYGNGKFVAGCSDGITATSSDGETWTSKINDIFDHVSLLGAPIQPNIYTIVYGNNKFVAGSSYCDTMYSSDGINWTLVAENALSGSIYTIAYGNNKFIAGDAGGRIAISSDGLTWASAGRSILGSDKFSYGYAVTGIAFGNNRFVAVGGGTDRIAYSTWK